MTIHWVLYRSVPASAPWPSAILDIARAAERNNAAAGLTGLLLFSDEQYLHYLEGSEEAVGAIFGRIAVDPRHAMLWSRSGTRADRGVRNLPLGYFDANREHSVAQEQEIWRDRASWTADQAEDLLRLLHAILVEKYPSSAGTARF